MIYPRKTLFFYYLLLLPIVTGLYSCEKQEGEGGLSSIKGRLIVKEYNNDYSVLQKQHPAQNTDIYINYGTKDKIGDDMETNFNGSFRFSNLHPGDYTIWYETEDTASGTANTNIVRKKEISLNKKEDKNLDTLYAYDHLDYDDGTASVTGKVLLGNYQNAATPPYDESDLKDITPAQEEDVYLVYNNHEIYDDDIETNYQGKYVFDDLIKGKYKVYVYSEDLFSDLLEEKNTGEITTPPENTKGTYDLAVMHTFEITKNGQQVHLDDLYIEQE